MKGALKVGDTVRTRLGHVGWVKKIEHTVCEGFWAYVYITDNPVSGIICQTFCFRVRDCEKIEA